MSVCRNVARYIQFGCERLRWNKSLLMRLLREHILIVTCLTKLHVSKCSDIRPTWPSAAAAATALHPVSITSHRKPARKMSLKSKSVPFSDLSPGLSREMLQWRQYAPDADPGPTRRVGNIYPGTWAVVHHHGGDSWSWFLSWLCHWHGIPTQAFPYFHRTVYDVADVKISYHYISNLVSNVWV